MVSMKALKLTWRGLKYAGGALLVIALLPFILCLVFCVRSSRPRRRTRTIVVEEEIYRRGDRYGRPSVVKKRYNPDGSRRTDTNFMLSGVRAISAAIGALLLVLGLRRKSGAQREREQSVIVEEGRRRRYRSRSPDLTVVEERSRSRSRRESRFPRPPPPPPPRRHPRYRPDSDDEIVVIEEYSPPPRRRPRRDSYSRPTASKGIFTRVWESLAGADDTHTTRRRDVVEERYWYGSRPAAPRRKKWPPREWFEKRPAPVRRRTREIYGGREERKPGFWQRFVGVWGLAALLGLKTSSRTRPRRGSRTSSLSYYSNSRRSSSTGEDRRETAAPTGIWKKFTVWLAKLPVWFIGLFKGKPQPMNSPRRSLSYGSGSTMSRRRQRSSSASSDRRSRHSRLVVAEQRSDSRR